VTEDQRQDGVRMLLGVNHKGIVRTVNKGESLRFCCLLPRSLLNKHVPKFLVHHVYVQVRPNHCLALKPSSLWASLCRPSLTSSLTGRLGTERSCPCWSCW
jgi:hypothetical protein